MNFVKKSARSFASSAFIIIKCLGSVLSALLWDYTCTIIIIIVITAPQSCSLARFSNKQKTSHSPPARFYLQSRLWPMMPSVRLPAGRVVVLQSRSNCVFYSYAALSFFLIIIIILLKAMTSPRLSQLLLPRYWIVAAFVAQLAGGGSSVLRGQTFSSSYFSFVNRCGAKWFSCCVLLTSSFTPPPGSLGNKSDWMLNVTEGSNNHPPVGAVRGSFFKVEQQMNPKETQSGPLKRVTPVI